MPTQILLRAVALLMMITLLPGGCAISFNPDPNDTVDPNDTGGPAPDEITIRVVNASANTLDPQIYIAGQPVTAAELFASSNKFTEYGVGRLGLIAGNDSDSFTISCADARVVGTTGGSFGGGDDGNDLTEPAGTGRQLVLTQELVFYCGDQITFTYSRSGDGFTTTFDTDP